MHAALRRVVPLLASPTRLGHYAASLAHEGRWRIAGEPDDPAVLTWSVAADVLGGMAIHWPRQLAPGVNGWVRTIVDGLASLRPLTPSEIPQPDRAMVLFDLTYDGDTRRIVLDCRDNNNIIEEFVPGALLYFKMQYLRGGYGDSRIVPAGYVPGDTLLYRGLPFLRARRDAGNNVFDVYGRYGLHSAAEIRVRAVTLLRQQPDFAFEGGVHRIRFSQHARETAQAKVCIDLPGQGDFCFRLVDYLAVGACIVAVRHRNALPIELRDGHEVAFVKPDLSDLVDVVRRCLEQPEMRCRMIASSRSYFDRYLHRRQLASYYLRTAARAAGWQAD